MQLAKRGRWLSWTAATIGLLVCCNIPTSLAAQEAASPSEAKPPEAKPPEAKPLEAIPARGLFNFREGTIEAWVRLDFDPAETVESYTARGTFFRLEVPTAPNDLGAGMNVFFCSLPINRKGEKNQARSFLRTGFSLDGVDVPHPVLADCTHWKRGEWHHVAVTWQEGRRMEVLFDGREVQQGGEYARMEFPHSIERDVPAGSLLYPVTVKQQPQGVTVDEFRLSSIARTPEELQTQQGPLKPDPFTMLLENFDTLKSGDSHFTTEPYTALATQQPAIVINGGHPVPGKYGQAWAFGEPNKN